MITSRQVGLCLIASLRTRKRTTSLQSIFKYVVTEVVYHDPVILLVSVWGMRDQSISLPTDSSLFTFTIPVRSTSKMSLLMLVILTYFVTFANCAHNITIQNNLADPERQSYQPQDAWTQISRTPLPGDVNPYNISGAVRFATTEGLESSQSSSITLFFNGDPTSSVLRDVLTRYLMIQALQYMSILSFRA